MIFRKNNCTFKTPILSGISMNHSLPYNMSISVKRLQILYSILYEMSKCVEREFETS